MGKYLEQIETVPQFGSGVMFFRKGERVDKAWNIAKDVWDNYQDYGFRPLDDEILAVSLAASGCKCTPSSRTFNICVYPQMKSGGWKPSPNMYKYNCTFTRPNEYAESAYLCHFGTNYTRQMLYKREQKILQLRIERKNTDRIAYYCYNIAILLSSMVNCCKKIIKKFYIFAKKLVRKLVPREINNGQKI